MTDYYIKYLKYKGKYLSLKKDMNFFKHTFGR